MTTTRHTGALTPMERDALYDRMDDKTPADALGRLVPLRVGRHHTEVLATVPACDACGATDAAVYERVGAWLGCGIACHDRLLRRAA